MKDAAGSGDDRDNPVVSREQDALDPPLQQVLALCGAPALVRPYLHLFYTAAEMRLMVLLGRRALSSADLAVLLRWRAPSGDGDAAGQLLDDAFRRQVVSRELNDGHPVYRVGSFYERLDNFSKFGNYYVLPRKVRQQLDEWCFQEYLQRNDDFQLAVTGAPDYQERHSEVILLLQEAEQLVTSAPAIRLVPCNCKMLADHCGHSREICLVLDPERIDERTGGRELSASEAVQLLRRLDREGLIHTGPYYWHDTGKGYLCNCCPCCCYPFRAAEKLGTKGRWPRSRYLAHYHGEQCRSCGLCASRCPFGAFQFDRERKLVAFDQQLCWGCGICANHCPDRAIEMLPV
jgi:Pyruvate/2-oxoacid:ferredoxin oxidoreductase delta subunit